MNSLFLGLNIDNSCLSLSLFSFAVRFGHFPNWVPGIVVKVNQPFHAGVTGAKAKWLTITCQGQGCFYTLIEEFALKTWTWTVDYKL